MSIINEFKEFALKGNVMDLAVGVVVGAAFTKIVNSMVTDIMMPVVSWATPGLDFKNGKYVLRAGDPAKTIPDVAIEYGKFTSIVIEFLIVALTLFLVIKGMNKLIAMKGNLVPGLGVTGFGVPGFGRKPNE